LTASLTASPARDRIATPTRKSGRAAAPTNHQDSCLACSEADPDVQGAHDEGEAAHEIPRVR
jgi:hypothetical protein